MTLSREDKAHGAVSFATYCQFFRAGGNFIVLALVLTFFISAEV